MEQLEILDTCLGTSYKIIQKGLDVLQQPLHELTNHQIVVVEENGVVLVILKADAEREDLANFGVQPEVEFVLEPNHVKDLLSELDQLKTVDRLAMKHYLLIRVAEDVFQNRHEVALEQYRITVVRDGELIVVTFADKDRSPTTRGHTPKRPGFEVALNPNDSTVQRASFVR